MAQQQSTTAKGSDGQRHPYNTAKIIELMGRSEESFEDAVRSALDDARETTRGISGAEIQNMSVRCEDGEITEFKVDLKVAFGIERSS